jgi:hypothetical protein
MWGFCFEKHCREAAKKRGQKISRQSRELPQSGKKKRAGILRLRRKEKDTAALRHLFPMLFAYVGLKANVHVCNKTEFCTFFNYK